MALDLVAAVHDVEPSFEQGIVHAPYLLGWILTVVIQDRDGASRGMVQPRKDGIVLAEVAGEMNKGQGPGMLLVQAPADVFAVVQ